MNMKKILMSLSMVLCTMTMLYAADVKKPKIMVFPSDDWCLKMGYVLPGTKTPDYEKALQNSDMDGAVAVMGDIMAEMGYEMFSLKQELKQIHTEDAYGMAVESKGGGMVEESDRDLITRNVGADFIVELSIEDKPFGARKAVEFKAQTIDAASKKILHGDIGTSSASSAPTPILVKEAVGGFIENFCHKIDLAFTNIEENGREGSITIKRADDCPLNFEDEITVDGESGELADYITYWIEEHAVNGNCSLTQKSRETLRYDQVRFPLVAAAAAGGFGSKKGRQRAQTMESFMSPISRDLSRFGISVTTVPIGQGSVYIVLGGN